MSLINKISGPFVLIFKDGGPDGRGGAAGEWVEGAAFEAALVKREDRPDAEGQRRTDRQRFLALTAQPLHFGDVFKRVEDGAAFRVTGDSDDSAPPPCATLRFYKVPCERWEPA